MLALGSERFDKPISMSAARSQLQTFRGKRHTLHSAVVLLGPQGKIWSHVEPAHIHMRDFSDTFLDRYLAEVGEDAMRSVGGYFYGRHWRTAFDRVDGDFFTVLGLPLTPLLRRFAEKPGRLINDRYREAKIAGVMGWPISHSRSPLIHGHWLERYSIDGAYIPFAVKPENGAAAFRALPKLGFSGTNVTLPHKLTAFQTVDVRDAAAEAIGAVNTVVVQSDGSLQGQNTDAPGLLAHLQASAPNWDASAAPVMVLGAGGSTRAAIFALLQGARLKFVCPIEPGQGRGVWRRIW